MEVVKKHTLPFGQDRFRPGAHLSCMMWGSIGVFWIILDFFGGLPGGSQWINSRVGKYRKLNERVKWTNQRIVFCRKNRDGLFISRKHVKQKLEDVSRSWPFAISWPFFQSWTLFEGGDFFSAKKAIYLKSFPGVWSFWNLKKNGTRYTKKVKEMN